MSRIVLIYLVYTNKVYNCQRFVGLAEIGLQLHKVESLRSNK